MGFQQIRRSYYLNSYYLSYYLCVLPITAETRGGMLPVTAETARNRVTRYSVENHIESHNTVEISDLLLLAIQDCGGCLESNPTRKYR